MKKVVIIGAGPAGLSAAYKLLNENSKIDVTIIEEDSQVGGISKTINHNGNRMDLGGHRFFTKNEQVKNFFFEILPLQGKPAYDDLILKNNKQYIDNGPNPEKEDSVMLIRNRISRIYYNKKFFDYPVNLNLKTLKNMGIITSINCGISYLTSSIFKKEETNLENFYINRFGKKLYSIFFKDYTTKLWGKEPKDISASWGSQRVKGVSIRKVFTNYIYKILKIKNKNQETSLIDTFYYPKYGPGHFYENIAKNIEEKKGKIILNSKVVSINKEKNKIKDITYIHNNKRESIKCDILISSMPIKDLISSMNNVDKKVKTVSDNLPYRDFLTIGVLVPKLLIMDKKVETIHNTVPDNWIYIQEKNKKMGRIQVFNNWSPYMVKNPKNTIWMGLEYFCAENDEFWSLKDNELVDIAKKELEDMKIADSDILDSCVIRVKKAYPAYFDAYDNIDVVRNYINKIENLYCIGRNGTHSYNNMDHSILSGFICADMIKENSHDLDKLWNINVDKSYQEEK